MTQIPEAWHSAATKLAGTITLPVAGFDVAVELAPAQLQAIYLPLLASLWQRAEQRKRVLAGLAGIPAGGKSVFAAGLEHVACELLGPGALIVVGMDGWHYPNAILDARTTLDADGRAVPLRTRKGGPASYDVDALTAALRALREASGDVRLPVYDRRLHDPRHDALVVGLSTRIVIVEGNYVLGGVAGSPQWDQVADQVTPRCFIDCDRELARERMIARHVRGGSSLQEAMRRYDANDRLNTELIEQTASRADWLIQLDRPAITFQP